MHLTNLAIERVVSGRRLNPYSSMPANRYGRLEDGYDLPDSFSRDSVAFRDQDWDLTEDGVTLSRYQDPSLPGNQRSPFPSQIGPFSTHLNVIVGPKGSGKTRLANHIRDLLLGQARASFDQNGIPLDNLFALDGYLQLEDGVRRYRLRADRSMRAVRVEHRLLEGQERHHDRSLEASYRGNDWRHVPFCLLQAILETESPSVPYHRDADVLRTIDQLGNGPLTSTTSDQALESLRQEASQLRARMERTIPQTNDRAWWLAERQRIWDRLHADRHEPIESQPWSDVRQLEDQLHRLQEEVSRLRKREDDLQHNLARRESDWETSRRTWTRTSSRTSLTESLRQQLQEIDDRLGQWRQTQQEVRSHRDGLQRSHDDLRLDLQLDQSNPLASEPRRGLGALETQILNARQDFERILHRNAWDDRRHSDHYFPNTFRSMQDGLYEVAQQITRSETRNLFESLSLQIDQLSRCDRELSQSIEQLIQERGQLLKKIADDYQIPFDRLSLAIGDWSQCQAHPHLYDWLLNDRDMSREPSVGIQEITWQEIERLRDELTRTRLRLEENVRSCHECEKELQERRLRSQSNGLPAYRLANQERRELQDRLVQAEESLRALEDRSALQRRLTEVETLLRNQRSVVAPTNTMFWSEVDRYYQSLSGDATATRYAYRDQSSDRMGSLSIGAPHYNRGSLAGYPSPKLAELAFRMAIADLIANHYVRVPMLIMQELNGLRGEPLDAAVRTLRQFCVHGQQVLVFTDDEEVASRIRAHQGWVCFLHGAAMNYRRFVDVRPVRNAKWESGEVNQELHAYANEHLAPAHEYAGYTERRFLHQDRRPLAPARTGKYFLALSDWIEEAPGVDIPLAQALRSLGIANVRDLLTWEPEQLSRSLQHSRHGSYYYSPQAMATLQSQSQLMCEVPRLRAFDARLLVACGITRPHTLAQLHPSELLNRVRQFLNTERGSQLLQSGSDYEVARIHTWLSSAGRPVMAERLASTSDLRNSTDRPRTRFSRRRTEAARRTPSHYPRRTVRSYEPRYAEPRYEEPRSYETRSYEPAAFDRTKRTGRGLEPRSFEASERSNRVTPANRDSHQASTGHQTRPFAAQHASQPQTANSQRTTHRQPRTPADRDPRVVHSHSANGTASQEQTQKKRRVVKMASEAKRAEDTNQGWRFYLELESPVVDAPSIGQQMADLLNGVGIQTVADLLAAEPSQLASRLNHRRTTAETIVEWQHQSRWMCRVPNLRGHDAQLLVAAGYHAPEQVSAVSVGELYSRISRVAESKVGQRLLRGSAAPDQAEITEWLTWIQHSRPLRAA